MKKTKISILFNPDKDITLNYTLYPIFMSNHIKHFDFFTKTEDLYLKDNNDKIIIVGKFLTKQAPSDKIHLLEKLTLKYKHLIFLDDLDGSEIQFFDYFNYFDLYFKKQMYADKDAYLKKLDGHKLFTDFYSKTMGESVVKLGNYNGQFMGKLKELEKLKVAWNLGVGPYPPVNSKLLRFILKGLGPDYVKYFQRKFPKKKIFKQKNIVKCQARFNYNPKRMHIDFQRKLFLELISDNRAFLAGTINTKDYLKEIQNVDAVLSPFGYGEVCFRDFESILNGAVLVKPEMNHLETWPNLYIPFETYLPVNWDGSDLLDKIDDLLSNSALKNELRVNAYNSLRDAHKNIDEKVLEFLDLIYSLK